MVRAKPNKGQSLTEATILLPLFLLAVFMIIQICHVGVGVALVNYAAGALARQAVQQNGYDSSTAQPRFNQLMVAGLKPGAITQQKDNSDITPNITITACASLPAYPFVGQFLDKALSSGGGNACGGTKSLGPVSLQTPAPYHFLIQGKATARMNYNPQ